MQRFILILLIFTLILKVYSHGMSVVFSWKQISYNIDGVLYTRNSDYSRAYDDTVHFADELEEKDKFFIQYNNVPIGFEVYGDIVFVTVPRRRYGIPSTLNYMKLSDSRPVLRPFPDAASRGSLVSVYRPRVDECGRLWAVDTGLLEVPEQRQQMQPPAIVVYNLHTKEQILRYELKATDLVDERTPAGLTSITVDVTTCEDTHAYITDLATNGLIVFSLKDRDSWRIEDDSFKLDERAGNFTAAGQTINWRDGLFSIALSDRDANGCRTTFFHPLVSTQEFAINTEALKMSKHGQVQGHVKLLGSSGPLTQSGSHDYQNGVLFFANVAQDGVLCWNTRRPLTPENIQLVAQDHEKLAYISDLKVRSGEVWVLVNQIPRFLYDILDPNQHNFFILKGKVQDLIHNTRCA